MNGKNSIQKSPGPLPPTYFFTCLIGGIVLHLALPVAQIVSWPIRLAGVVPGLLGGVLTVWADQIFKRLGTTVKPHRDPSVLVTTGPFRISRHPMYLGMTLTLLGLAVLSGSVTAFASPLAFALIMQVKFIPIEERALEQVFGEQYIAYKTHVRPWL